jgi:hypothetical protein
LLPTGIAGLLFSLVIGLLIACPTPTQQHTLQIVLSISAAMAAASIPGFLNIHISGGSAFGIRAGGALAVFVLLYKFGPAPWFDERVAASFSNASCQGQLPVGMYIHQRDLPPALDPSKVGSLSPDASMGRPVHFSINYTFQPSPGIRDWTQVKPGVWIERYPDPTIFTAFREIERKTLDGCAGTVVSPDVEPSLHTFIPDKGCKLMWARFQHGSGEWAWFGEMQDIR